MLLQKLKAATHSSPWFYAFLLISFFLCFVTLFAGELPRFLIIFNLRNENNLAALFSGMFLLTVALQAFDGSEVNRASAPPVANAWLVLSLVLLALSFDEIGSLHEQLNPFMKQFDFWGDWSAWWTLAPIGLFLIGVVTYAFITLFRVPGQRRTVILICIGFALLASVALQEYIEQNLDWTANRALRIFKARLRPTVEEGTELLGMLVLLWATLHGTRADSRAIERVRFPDLKGVIRWRQAALLLILFGAPIVAYITVTIPESRHDNGAPADWPAAALYFLAALGAARPFFASGHRLSGFDWVLVIIAALGCASTILRPDSSIALPLMTLLGAATFLVWILSPRYAAHEYAYAAILLSIALAGAWLMPPSDFILYTLAQYVGLAIYWVNASNDGTFDQVAQIPATEQ
jgi:hypothetical protein